MSNDRQKILFLAMGDKLKAISPGIHAIPKVNQSLFRLNRDTRFSKDKTPYKTNLGIWFWEGERKRMECSGFYFYLGEGNLMLGTGIHVFSKGIVDHVFAHFKKMSPLHEWLKAALG